MKNVFDWVKEITTKKSPPNSFSEEDWGKWNSYMVHKVLSMNPNLIPLVNEVQEISPQNHKQIYSIYREYVPKDYKWYKYIKSKNKKPNQDLLNHLVGHYELSTREVKDYLNILSPQEIKDILINRGIEDKEIKKLLK